MKMPSVLYNPPCHHDENFAFPAHATIFKGNGFWPTDGSDTNRQFRRLDRLYNLWNWVVIFSVTMTVFSEFLYLFASFKNVSEAAESMSTVMIKVMVCIRMLHMRYARLHLKTVLGIFADKIWIKSESHPHIFERCMRNLRPTFYLCLSIMSGLVFYVGLPLAFLLINKQSLQSSDKRLPYLLLLPFDQQKPFNYILTYVVSSFTSSLCFLQFYAMDAVLTLFISFSCGQFEILQGAILRLIPECHVEWLRSTGAVGTSQKGNLRDLQDIYNRRLHALTAHHSDIIRFCMELQKFFSFPLFVNMLISTLLIGLGVFQILAAGQNSFGDLMRYFLYLTSVGGQLYVICDAGTLLIVQSTDTARHLFMCNWEGGHISKDSPLLYQSNEMELDVLTKNLPSWRYINYHPAGKDFRKKLSLMILRSHRPVQLTAMNFAILSMETFSRILSSSVSYFTLLKSFMDKQNY